MAKEKVKKATERDVQQIKDQMVLLQHALQQANGHLGRLMKLLLRK